jgi:hypothetical protein
MNTWNKLYDNEENTKQDFRFSFRGDSREISYDVTINDEQPWMDVLDQFLSFLGSVYEYEIRDQVKVVDSPEFFDIGGK